MRFESERVREAFLRAVGQDSGGVPAAIRGMLEGASSEAEVTRARDDARLHAQGWRALRGYDADGDPRDDAGRRRPLHRERSQQQRALILSGVGIALFLGVCLLMWRLK